MNMLLTLVLMMAATPAFADGTSNMDLRSWNGRTIVELTRTGNAITGSISPAQMSPFVNLSNASGSWQGQLGQQVSSVKVSTNNNGTTSVVISALPSGWYSYTVKTKSNGDVEVNGTGPSGNLNSAGYKASKGELYASSMSFSYDLTSNGDGSYDGNVVMGSGMNSGDASLTTSGDLDPAVAVNDPALFVLLYVFPYTR